MNASMTGTYNPYMQTLETLLQAKIKISERPNAAVTRFRYFDSSSVDVLTSSGDAVSITNGASRSSSIYLYRMIKGRCKMRHDQEVTLNSGEFVAFHGHRKLEVIQELPYEMIGVRLPTTSIQSQMPGWDLAEFTPIHRTSSEGDFLFDIANDLLNKGSRLNASALPIVAESIGRLLVHSLTDTVKELTFASGSRNKHHRERIKNFCRHNLASPDLTVTSIGHSLGLSPAHIHRVFRNEPLTLMDWVLNQRLETCHEAIRSGTFDLSLSKLAFSLGFKDAAHFSNAFKRRFGLCPRELRHQRREADNDKTA